MTLCDGDEFASGNEMIFIQNFLKVFSQSVLPLIIGSYQEYKFLSLFVVRDFMHFQLNV